MSHRNTLYHRLRALVSTHGLPLHRMAGWRFEADPHDPSQGVLTAWHVDHPTPLTMEISHVHPDEHGSRGPGDRRWSGAP